MGKLGKSKFSNERIEDSVIRVLEDGRRGTFCILFIFH